MTTLPLSTGLGYREGWAGHESIPKVTTAPSGCHSNRTTPHPPAYFFFLTFQSVLRPLALTTSSHVFLFFVSLCVWLPLLLYRNRRTLQERWLSGWPTPQSCSTSSSRTETSTASRWTPRTSSPIWFRWLSSQCVCGCVCHGVSNVSHAVTVIVLFAIDGLNQLKT